MKLIKQQIWRDNPENLLLDFLENQVSISITDIMGRIVYANNKFCELYEIPEEKIKGELNGLLKTERHSNPIYKDLWTVVKSGQIWKGTLNDYSSAGKLYNLDTTVIPARNKKGEIDRYVAFYVRMQPNYNDKLNIVNTSAKANMNSDTMAHSVLTINVFSEILYANKGIGGLSDKEVTGCSLYNFISPIFHDMVKKIIKQVFDSGTPDHFETIGVNHEGVNTIFSSQIGPVINSKGIVISATISTQEIINSDSIQQQLSQNEAKYHAIFQSMKVGIIVVVDNNGKVTDWNKGAERAFGYSEDEILGEYLTKLLSSKNRATSLIELMHAVKDLQDFNPSDTFEMRGLKKNGTEFPIEFALSKWTNGDSAFYCAMMLDISKRKKLECKLKQKTKELEVFMYRSAHDLRAPLSSAEGLLNLIREEDISDSVLNLASMIDITIDKGKELIDKLIFASEVSEKKNETSYIDFKEIIENNIQSFNGLKNFNDIEFNINIDDSIAYYSSVDLMISLFQSLIQNAIKYRVVNNSQRKPVIAIEVKKVKNSIKIKVSDNGIGILKKNLSKIFDLYFRENIEETPGSGLGLYIVKNIVEDLKGEIRVTSKVNEGTSFIVKLKNLKNLKTA